MSPRDVEPLPKEVERLLATERNFPPESASLHYRAMARARAALEGNHVSPARRTRQKQRVWLLTAALACTLASISFAAWHAWRPAVAPPEPATQTATANPPRLSTAEPEVPSRKETNSEQANYPEQVNHPTPDRPKARVSATPRQPLVEDAFRRELSVLQRARAAVAKGKFASALESIQEHQRRFPTGNLREEREALRVRALLGLERTEEARGAAARFQERFPNSVLSPRIEESVRKPK